MPVTPNAASVNASPINTAKVTDRRALRFATLREALADAERCAAADRAGTLRRTGNWTAGQVFGHLAYWIDGGFDGYAMNPPWFLRLLGPLMKKSVLKPSTRAGMRLPGAPGGTYGTDVYSTDDGLARFRAAVDRLERQCPQRPNPVFGRMTHDEWKTLHIRHAEGHLSFLHPGG
jgi:hypothetical protein